MLLEVRLMGVDDGPMPRLKNVLQGSQECVALAWADLTAPHGACSSQPWSALPLDCSLRDNEAVLQEDAAWHAFIEPVWEVGAVFHIAASMHMGSCASLNDQQVMSLLRCGLLLFRQCLHHLLCRCLRTVREQKGSL